MDSACAEAGNLSCLHGCVYREQAKPWHRTLPLDTRRIRQLVAKHLHTPANTDYETTPGLLVYRSIEIILPHPLEVAHGLFTSREDHDVSVCERRSGAAELEINRR